VRILNRLRATGCRIEMRKRRKREDGKNFYIEDVTSHVSFTEKRAYLCTVGLCYFSLIEV